jgi:lipoprotein-anchoring transpeptidase ErfK/SrfK
VTPRTIQAVLVALVVSLSGCGSFQGAASETGGSRAVGVVSEDGRGDQRASAELVGAADSEAQTADSGGDQPAALPMADEGTAVIVGHVIGDGIVAHERPDDTSPAVAELANPTDVGGPLAFRLVSTEPPDGVWTEVYLPVRPNGTTGWVRTAELQLSLNPYRIEVDRAGHTMRVFRSGAVWLETDVAIGTGNTPTPVGEFYIIELLQPPSPNGIYGPFAFGLSGFSETLTSFAGGDGVIGIHGTNEPEAIGTDVSHGCIRVANDVISQLAGTIPLGTPVQIT